MSFNLLLIYKRLWGLNKLSIATSSSLAFSRAVTSRTKFAIAFNLKVTPRVWNRLWKRRDKSIFDKRKEETNRYLILRLAEISWDWD